MNYKKLRHLLAGLSARLSWADTPPEPRTEPELRLRTAQPQRSDDSSVWPKRHCTKSRVVQVNAETLLANLEYRAMKSALAAQNIAGTSKCCCLFTRTAATRCRLGEFARATVAQAEGRSARR